MLIGRRIPHSPRGIPGLPAGPIIIHDPTPNANTIRPSLPQGSHRPNQHPTKNVFSTVVCGIAGQVRVRSSRHGMPTSVDPRVGDLLKHRGPDGEGFLRSTIQAGADFAIDVHLLHRRLAVIDPAGGRQPMARSPRTDLAPRDGEHSSLPPDAVAVAFNGCIYNHRAIRRELESLGVRFSSNHSDTETIVQGWATWGEDLLPKLDGMFALAVLDQHRGMLTLARDRAGEKPLYFARRNDAHGIVFAFSSTPPGVLASLGSGCSPVVDPAALARWLAFGFGPDMPIAGLRELSPGSLLRLPLNTNLEPATRPWWTPAPRGSTPTQEGTRAMIERAVAARLDADVPLGCFLSGGIDSPVVAALASRFRPDLRTFTLRMPDAPYDESPRALEIARHLGTRHTTLDVRPDPVADLTILIDQLMLPFGDSSILPTYWVSKAMREHATVALGGDGADELFDGYARYRAAGLLRRFGPLLACLPSLGGESAHPRSRRSRWARLVHAARGWGYDDILAIFPRQHFRSLLPTFSEPAHETPADPSRRDALTSLPGDLLRKVDTASMAVALEVRSPFLATEVLESRLSGPTPDDAGAKRELRAIAATVLPQSLTRAPKSGFAIPLSRWFREDFGSISTTLRDLLASPATFSTLGLPLDRKAALNFAHEHISGLSDHAQRLFALLVLALFEQRLAHFVQR
jgi:asparagine synthase (glutamine-hydrolysing)